MNKEAGLQLKAVGLLAVIFAHVGYGLFAKDNFLGPLSNYAGVAVDLFYFLSAYGLALSFGGGAKAFYVKRLKKLMPPVFIMLIAFFALDFFVRGESYGIGYTIQSFFLIFPTSDLFTDINSPLWYITPLIGYYALFPFFFQKGRPILSAALFLFMGAFLTLMPFIDVHFGLHFLAFPLGILYAGYAEKIEHLIASPSKKLRSIIMCILAIILVAGPFYSGVGTEYEQYGSIAIMLCLIALWTLGHFSSRALILIGTYSFEIYLLHWPLISRFDFLYFLRTWPIVWLVLWTLLLIGFGFILNWLTLWLSRYNGHHS